MGVDPGWNEKAVFLEALDLPAPQREEFLRRACPTDEARRRIEALLAHHATLTSDLLELRASDTEASAAPHPERIDEFQILRRLGEGGMGVVYLAEDLLLGRRVALKVIARHLTGSEAALGRFRDEARNAATLNHPAVVPVHKFAFSGEYHYIVSAFVEGDTLGQHLEAQRERRAVGAACQTWYRQAAEYIATIADALDAAHRVGIIHRDVKPSNILIDPERGARLTDFGIAKQVSTPAGGEPSHLIGTAHYMSPEQAEVSSRGVDHRSDIFSLGVVLYECLTFRRPFDGRDVLQVLRAVILLDPPRVRALERSVPRDLETICHKAIEKSPDRRYQTMAHMAADLRCFLAGQPILALPPGYLRRAGHWIRRRSRVVGGAAILVLLACVVSGAALWVRQAQANTLAWVRLEAGAEVCRVYLQSFDAETCVPGTARLIGLTPIPVQRLSPGQHRLSLQRVSDGATCEFNLVLRDIGPAHERVLRLSEAVARFPDDAAPADLRDVGRILVGVLRSADSIPESEMIRVPAATYSLSVGANIGRVLANPVKLDEFLIDVRKVSNRDYAEFLHSTGFRRPAFWSALGDPAVDHPDLPVVGVALEEAEAYARWRGKRLPTLHEWQAAARGPAGDSYPGGAGLPELIGPDPSLAAAARSPRGEDQAELYLRGTAPVGRDDVPTLPGRPLQMFSNVRDLTGTVDGELSNVFTPGRTWFEPPGRLTLAIVDRAPRAMPSLHCGFRCAKSVLVNPPKP